MDSLSGEHLAGRMMAMRKLDPSTININLLGIPTAKFKDQQDRADAKRKFHQQAQLTLAKELDDLWPGLLWGEAMIRIYAQNFTVVIPDEYEDPGPNYRMRAVAAHRDFRLLLVASGRWDETSGFSLLDQVALEGCVPESCYPEQMHDLAGVTTVVNDAGLPVRFYSDNSMGLMAAINVIDKNVGFVPWKAAGLRSYLLDKPLLHTPVDTVVNSWQSYGEHLPDWVKDFMQGRVPPPAPAEQVQSR